jgi:hypothetical protein
MIRQKPTEKMNTETKTKIDELIARLGVTIESSNPALATEKSKADGRVTQWHHIAFNVTIRRGEKAVWEGPYRMGLGNFPEFKDLIGRNLTVHAEDEIWASVKQRNPRRIFRTRPSLPDVLFSLLSDGSAFFDAESFEEWADNYGFDTDSRKAERMFQECMETGRKLSRAFNAAEITELRDAFADY